MISTDAGNNVETGSCSDPFVSLNLDTEFRTFAKLLKRVKYLIDERLWGELGLTAHTLFALLESR